MSYSHMIIKAVTSVDEIFPLEKNSGKTGWPHQPNLKGRCGQILNKHLLCLPLAPPSFWTR